MLTMKVLRTWLLGTMLALGAPMAHALLIIDGTFSGTFPGGSAVPSISGSFQAQFDDSVLTGVGFESFDDLNIVTAFSMTPNPLGATTFDTSNVGVDLDFVNGTLDSLILGTLSNASLLQASDDEFFVLYDSSLVATRVAYTIATEAGIIFANTFSGSLTLSSAVPAPGTLVLLIAGFAGAAAAGRFRAKRA